MTTSVEHHIGQRARRRDYQQWRSMVESVGGCARPIRLRGSHHLQHASSGAPIYHSEGDIFVACGNRRESICPTCSDRYAADAFHLIRAGLSGGEKDVTETVRTKPRAFVTLTAPSFGAVHNHRVSPRGRPMPCTGCGDYHHKHDPRIGAPVDPDRYDYDGAVLWQAHASALWARFTTALRRELARALRVPVRDFRDHLRLSYGKVAEYQARGLVHFHAIIRLDGPAGPADPVPPGLDDRVLDETVRAAAGRVAIDVPRPTGEVLTLAWGRQVDIRRVQPTVADQLEDSTGEISEDRLAGYIAKYTTKGTSTDVVDRPIRSQHHIDHLRISDHHRAMIATAWRLGGLDTYDGLGLRRWAHMLGFRGHFLTKSQRYSVTFGHLRSERRRWRLNENLAAADLDPTDVIVINEWDFVEAGYHDDAERELAHAIAARVREHRKHKHQQEHAQKGAAAWASS